MPPKKQEKASKPKPLPKIPKIPKAKAAPKTKATGKKKTASNSEQQEEEQQCRQMDEAKLMGVIKPDLGDLRGEKKRETIMNDHRLRDAEGKFMGTKFIQFNKCMIVHDAETEAELGMEIGLVRPTCSAGNYQQTFIQLGWDAQFAGIACIHMTAEIAKILNDMALYDQHVWLGRRETLDQYDHFIIDGAHRVTLGKLHFPASDKGGYFMLLHPSVPYEDRDSLAVSGNEIAETTNKTTFLDRCVMV